MAYPTSASMKSRCNASLLLFPALQEEFAVEEVSHADDHAEQRDTQKLYRLAGAHIGKQQRRKANQKEYAQKAKAEAQHITIGKQLRTFFLWCHNRKL